MHLTNSEKLIAIVIGSMVGGGRERISIDIVKYLIHANYRVELVLFELKGELLDQVPRGVEVYVVGKKKGLLDETIEYSIQHTNVKWMYPNLRHKIPYSDFFNHVLTNWPYKLLKKFPHRRKQLVCNAYGFSMYLTKNKPDCVLAVHIPEIFATLIGREICGLKTPIIFSVHGQITPKFGSRSKKFAKLLKKANWAHSVSNGLKEEICKQSIFPANRVSVIYNFVDSQRVLHLAKLPTSHPWFDRKKAFGHKIILSVGRLHPDKNFKLLIRSFARLKHLGNLKLVILGGWN